MYCLATNNKNRNDAMNVIIKNRPHYIERRPSLCIRECSSTLYVGLARAVPPTNTNFLLTFLLARLEEALYEDLPVQSIKFEVYHHFSGLSFKVEVSFWRPTKTIVSCDFFIIIIVIIQHFFIRVFSEDTETNNTSLLPLDTNFLEICAFKIGFSCTVWTKMRSLRAH